jgi:transcription elongation GreA/GreB family factor
MASVEIALDGTRRHCVVQPDHAHLKEQVEQALERLSQLLLAHTRENLAGGGGAGEDTAEIERIGRMTRFLGQVRAAWLDLPENALPLEGAGFGSSVLVEDLDQSVRDRYTLMTGALLDIDSDQVSLASPIGQALLGARPGESRVVETPQRRRRLRVVAVRTLQDRIDDELPPRLPAA